MSKINTKFIYGLDEAVEKLFAPVIAEGQSFTCYVDEEMSPYTILGDNILYPQSAASSEASNILELHSLTAEDISAKGFALARNIADGQQNFVSISLNGIPLVLGIDFSIVDNSVSLDELPLDAFGLQSGDILIISYRPA